MIRGEARVGAIAAGGGAPSMIRVLQAINSYERGGAETLAWSLARSLPQWGVEAVVCAMGRGDAGREAFVRRELAASGVRAVSLHDAGRAARVARMRELRRLIRSEGIDVVHLHAVAPVSLAAFAEPIACVYTFHSERHQGRLARATTLLERGLAMGASTCIAPSVAAAEAAVRRTGIASAKMRVVRNGIDLGRFVCPGAEARRAARKDKLSPLGPWQHWLLSVGRLEANKAHDVVIRVAAELCRRGLSAGLVIAGRSGPDPGYTAGLRALAREQGIASRVHFLGPVDDVERLLWAADVLVQASYSESFGIAAVEAMAAGTGLVASDISAHREISEGGKHCRLCAPGDVEAFAGAVTEILTAEPGETQRRASEYARLEYGVERAAREHAEVYREAISRPGPVLRWARALRPSRARVMWR